MTYAVITRSLFGKSWIVRFLESGDVERLARYDDYDAPESGKSKYNEELLAEFATKFDHHNTTYFWQWWCPAHRWTNVWVNHEDSAASDASIEYFGKFDDAYDRLMELV